MPLGLPISLFFAQAAEAAATSQVSHPVYGPAAPSPPKPATVPEKPGERECAPQSKDPKSNEIIVCAVKPEGYRLPADIVEARRLKKQGITVRPHNPHETYADHSCATIGPMGCRGVPTVNLLAVAATAAQISKRLAKGQEIGSIFETTPHSSDYQFYLEAKKRREEKEAEAAAKAQVAQANAAAKAKLPRTQTKGATPETKAPPAN